MTTALVAASAAAGALLYACARAVEAAVRREPDARAVASAKAALCVLAGGEVELGARLAEESAAAGGVGLAQIAGQEMGRRSGLAVETCVAAVLPFAMAFNRKVAARQLAALAPALGSAFTADAIKGADAAIASVRELGLRSAFPRNFRALGIKREVMEGTAKALPDLTRDLVRPVASYDEAMLELFRFAW